MSLEANLLKQADTLAVLERMPAGYADLVYLDPPWVKSSTLFSPLSADEYYTYIFKVIQQSHRILKETGNLFFYSDPDLNADFHLSLREIFGIKHFEAEFVIPTQTVSLSRIGQRHHTLLLYKKSDESYLNGKVRRLNKQEMKSHYPYSDEKGIFRTLSLLMPGEYSTLTYTWKGYTPPQGYRWRFSKERLDMLDQEGMVVLTAAEPRVPFRLKQYLMPENEFVLVSSIWDDIPVWQHNQDYPGSQGVELFDRILNIGSAPGDLVIDLFCGSGSLPVTALSTDRKCIACDIDKRAINITLNRLNEMHASYSLLKEVDIRELPIIWNKYKPYQFSDENSLTALIIKGESATLEFKESAKWNHRLGQPDEAPALSVMRAVAAFLNSPSGGTILIGVKDNKELIGLEKDFEHADRKKKNQDGYALFLTSKISTLFGPLVIGLFYIRFYNINSKDICRIDVLPGNEPFFLDGKYIIRNNNQSTELSTQDFYQRFKSESRI